MRRAGMQFVAAVGLLIASAIFNLGPSANAAYLSSADSQASACDGDRELQKSPRTPIAIAELQGCGGMSAPASGPSSVSIASAGILSRVEPPANALVVYLREPSSPLRFSSFIDSILDPPRAS